MTAEVIIDWNQLKTLEEFFDNLFSQVGAPEWHGRGLDALNDSLVIGQINKIGPPYAFKSLNTSKVTDDLVEFQQEVIGIFVDSVRENTGGEVLVK